MFTPENDLERALVLAATDPATRPEFYRILTASEIFAIQYGPSVLTQTQESIFEAGTKLAFQTLQKGDQKIIPIFSSLLRLQNFLRMPADYMALPTVEFFKLTLGTVLVLNPGSEYGKEFTPSEVAKILNGWKPDKTYVTEKETPVRLGQPADYPFALTEALSRLFSTIKEVESAYLAHFHNPDQGDPPHTLIGIKAIGDWNNITAQAGMALAGVKIPNPPVDFLRMTGSAGAESYLLTTKPFYKRKTFGLF